MLLEAKQFKTVSVAKFKALDEGAGGGEGYPSVFWDLDEVGDVAVQGCYKRTLPQFLINGFIANAHEWDEAVGYPTMSNEDDYGLNCGWAFHSTADAQDVRTRAAERKAAGKSVKLSIGYQVMKAVWVQAMDFATGLAEYIPAPYIPAIIAKATQMGLSGIRLLLDVELFEFSFVTVPALRSAEVTGVKGQAGSLADDDSYAAHSARLADDLGDYVRRTKARLEMRTKAGRMFSSANVSRMKEIHGTCSDALDDLLALITSAEPVEQEPDGDEGKGLDALMAQMELRNLARRALIRESALL